MTEGPQAVKRDVGLGRTEAILCNFLGILLIVDASSCDPPFFFKNSFF